MATVVCGALPALATTVPLPTRFDALSTPPAEIVPMPPVTVHATVRPEIALPNASLGGPLNARVPPAPTVPVGGDTSIRASGPGAIGLAKSCLMAPAPIVHWQ